MNNARDLQEHKGVVVHNSDDNDGTEENDEVLMTIVRERATGAPTTTTNSSSSAEQNLAQKGKEPLAEPVATAATPTKLQQEPKSQKSQDAVINEVDIDDLMMAVERDRVTKYEESFKPKTIAQSDHRQGVVDGLAAGPPVVPAVVAALEEDEPGAYAVGGIDGQQQRHEDVQHQDHEAETPEEAPGQRPDQHPHDSSLAVAREVLDHSHEGQRLDLPRAQELDDGAQQLQDSQRKGRHTSIFIVAVVTIAAAVVVAIVTSVRLTQRGSDNDKPFTTTAAPTPTPTSLESYVLSLLPDYTLKDIQENNASPQARAYEWILQDPSLVGNYPTSSHLLYPKDRILQRFALATFFYATNGQEWFNNTHWLSHQIHECFWHATTFDNLLSEGIDYFDVAYPNPCEENVTTPGDSGQLEQGQYKHIWLFDHYLQGTLPREFFLLTYLRSVQMGLNSLSGTIPSDLGNLTTLEFADFSSNDFEGTLPTELLTMTNLTALLLTYSPQISGTIPSEVGLMTSLKHLLLDQCDFYGTIPTELGELKRLNRLFLYGTEITGTIPTELGNMDAMWELALDETMITGTVPTELGKLSNMLSLWFNRNQLIGTIPSELGLMTTAFVFLLFENQLTGTIPTELGQLLWTPRLDEEHTDFFCCYRSIALFDNALTGPIPTEFGSMDAVQYLHLHNNDLSGSIPAELEALALTGDLQELNVSGTLLSGVVPEELCFINATSFDCSPHFCGCDCNCTGNVTTDI